MDRLLKISEFAKLSGISRKLLIFYDKIGILNPKYVDPQNGYRYYSYRQIDTASVIVSFREAGLSLESIKHYLNVKSPENLIKILHAQKENLEDQIQKLNQVMNMVMSRMEQTKQGITIREEKIWIQNCAAENLFLGPELPEDYQLSDGWNYLPSFYEACIRQGIQLGFTVGSLVEYQNLIQKLWNKPSYYYYRLPKGQYPAFYTKPSGSYVIGTQYTDYGCTDALYRKIFDYIKKHNLKICGNAYEEFLIDEIAEKDPEHYLFQVSVQIDSYPEII